jgi:hypothetical protein
VIAGRHRDPLFDKSKAKRALDGSTGRPAGCGPARVGLFDSVNLKNHETTGHVIYAGSVIDALSHAQRRSGAGRRPEPGMTCRELGKGMSSMYASPSTSKEFDNRNVTANGHVWNLCGRRPRNRPSFNHFIIGDKNPPLALPARTVRTGSFDTPSMESMRDDELISICNQSFSHRCQELAASWSD